MVEKISAVAFDYGGVLARMIDDSVICHMADTVGASVDSFRKSLWQLRHDYDLGVMEAAEYWRKVSVSAGASWSEDPSAQSELLETLMHLDAIAYSIFNPGILRWIRTLRAAGYRCLMISNMAGETYDLLMRNTLLEQQFERVILSGWIHINKPDPEIFLEAVRQLELNPEEILFLDDLMHNVDGARKVGLRALQFTDTESLYKELSEQFPQIPRTGLLCE